MAGKALLFLFWIPKPPHIWMTWVFESLDFAFFTDWERMVKMCLKRPQCGRHPKKFSHIDTKAAKYVMVELSTEKVQEPPEERMRGK